jgi:hypothetical protein
MKTSTTVLLLFLFTSANAMTYNLVADCKQRFKNTIDKRDREKIEESLKVSCTEHKRVAVRFNKCLENIADKYADQGKISRQDANAIVECYEMLPSPTNCRDINFDFIEKTRVRVEVKEEVCECQHKTKLRRRFLSCVKQCCRDMNKKLTFNDSQKIMKVVKESDINRKKTGANSAELAAAEEPLAEEPAELPKEEPAEEVPPT